MVDKVFFISYSYMGSTVDLDTLTGKEVLEAFALRNYEHGCLQQVVFQVEELYLVIAVNSDSDEITLSILPEFDFTAQEQQFSKTTIANQRKTISWIWRMTNQYGYEDGFQLEFDDVEGTSVQLLSEAAQLKLYIFQRY